MSDTPAPAKTAPTTTPRNTHVEVTHTAGEGIYLYRPEDNALIALYPDEWRDCRQEAHENKVAIEELQAANKAVTEQSLALHELLRQPNAAKATLTQAQRDLDSALETQVEKSEAAKKRIEAITDQKTDPSKLVELLPLTLKRSEKKATPIHISAKRLKAALADHRIYLVEGEAERKKPAKEKLFNGAKLNVKEARNRLATRVQDKAKFAKKWKFAPDGADQYAGILTEWAEVMGTTATACLERGKKEITEGILKGVNSDPNSPERVIDVRPEAQFMRWAAGAGTEANFMPFQGNLFDQRDKTVLQKAKRLASAAQFNVKANAEASFAIGEAKVETSLYLPHAAGWNLTTGESEQSLNLGHFRLRADLKLYALAGASIALEAGAAVMITAGKQGLKGTPKNEGGSKAKIGVKGEAKIFAGLKEGVGFSGALQWLSPEGYIDSSEPKKADFNKVLAQYVDMASVGADAAFIQGLAAAAGFQCDYRNGNFVIAAKASYCLGLGGEGKVAAKVGVEQITQFMMFLAHQLKHADYKKIINIVSELAFFCANKILYINLLTNQKLGSLVGIDDATINKIYEKAFNKFSYNGDQGLRELEQKLSQRWGWHPYMPPEARGAVLASIVDTIQKPENSKNRDLINLAAFSINEIVSTTQSLSHLNNTLDRLTIKMGQKSDRNQNIAAIESIVADTQFHGCIHRCDAQLANAEPLMQRPFMRNDEPSFMISRFPLHHPIYRMS
jgi:hypothetical protein